MCLQLEPYTLWTSKCVLNLRHKHFECQNVLKIRASSSLHVKMCFKLKPQAFWMSECASNSNHKHFECYLHVEMCFELELQELCIANCALNSCCKHFECQFVLQTQATRTLHFRNCGLNSCYRHFTKCQSLAVPHFSNIFSLFKRFQVEASRVHHF